MERHDVVLSLVVSLLIFLGALFIYLGLRNKWMGHLRTWYIVYPLLLIVVYPGLYLLDPDGLAQTDANHEPGFSQELQKVSRILTKAVNNVIRSEPNPANKPIGCAIVDLQDADSHGITGAISYTNSIVSVDRCFDSDHKTVVSNLETSIEIRAAAIPSAPDNNSDQAVLPYWAFGHYRAPSSSGTDEVGAALAQQLFVKHSSPPDGVSKLYINADELSEVHKLKKAAGGQVGSLDSTWSLNNIARIEYFSAVTMTTLGYGDIVPVEWSARFMVMSEAVLGLLMIGLFINALWLRHSKSQQLFRRALQRSRMLRDAGWIPGEWRPRSRAARYRRKLWAWRRQRDLVYGRVTADMYRLPFIVCPYLVDYQHP